MNIYISDLSAICNIDDLARTLGPDDLTRYKSFTRPLRAKQFIVAHSIKSQIANQFKYISIAHKNNFVIVAASQSPIGVDIEDASIPRDFDSLADFMNFSPTTTQDDFYRAFTLAEAKYKTTNPNATARFYKLHDYMICIVSDDSEIIWENKALVPEQI